MKSTKASCVIDYPGKPATALTTQPLATRLRILIVDTGPMVPSSVNVSLEYDAMLDIVQLTSLPQEISNFQVVIFAIRAPDETIRAQLLKLSTSGIYLIIVCEDLVTDIAKLAVQCKADDLITLDDIQEHLYTSLSQAASRVQKTAAIAPLTVILNGKAGSGATFLSCGIGEVFNSVTSRQLALIDADFNYPSLAHGLRLESKYSIDEATCELDKLDEAAVHSMMPKQGHLHLIGNPPFSRLHAHMRTPQKLDGLCWKIRQAFDDVLVDMSKGLEVATLPVLKQATRVLLVMQLSVASLRETKALLEELRHHMTVSNDNVAIVVNRYIEGKGEIQLEDVKSVLHLDNIFTVSNNYALAKLRTDLGTPLDSLANHKAISIELQNIARFSFELATDHTNRKAGFFSRLLRKS